MRETTVNGLLIGLVVLLGSLCGQGIYWYFHSDPPVAPPSAPVAATRFSIVAERGDEIAAMLILRDRQKNEDYMIILGPEDPEGLSSSCSVVRLKEKR